MKGEEKRRKFIRVAEKALNEMEKNKILLLKRGDIFENKESLYKEIREGIATALSNAKEGGSFKENHRYLHINVFSKNESFLMDVFDTMAFPCLFVLFEMD